MKRFLKSFRHGEKGFTLIELLVVIAILGVLAVVVLPNLGKFFGRGKVEAANTEQANVVTAVAAVMADCELVTLPGPGMSVGPGEADDITGCGGVAPDPAVTAGSFLINKSTLQAVYTFDANGNLTGAALSTPSKWDGIFWWGGAWHKEDKTT